MRARRRSEAGTASLEMIIVTPLLLLIFLIIADFGRVFYTAITLAHAARAGAQYGAQSNLKSGDSAGIQQAATQEAADIGAITVTSQQFCECPGGVAVSCTGGPCDPSYGPPQVYCRVTASRTFTTLFSYLYPSTVPLSQTATLRVH